MYNVKIPRSEEELQKYFHFRWKILREPFNLPEGSEKDEYESVSEHRMITDNSGRVLAVGRIHLNAPEEAQIKHVAVEKNMRTKGLGKLIIAALEDVARKQGAERIVTNSMETSVEFFRHCGFEIQEQAPKELDKQKRQQMLKRIKDKSALRMHPKWCEELQKTWYETIPITEHMGIKLHQYSGRTLEVRASLNKNINLHGTMFAGSIFSLATLTGWGMIFLQLKQKKLSGEIVLGDGNIHYHKPVTSQPRAVCNIETMSGDYEYLRRGKKCRLNVTVNIQDGDVPVAEFKGIYWIIPEEPSES
ncbi:YiiD C-terminal domain-containing protein [Paraneptunicella aestuarii]|uniref:bifunctional GNAT family N-acetyltransferase/hotdog fold thioesterase n=1 Tax=Paraneptunicella aestuarii TaxID=2831148 RepID=UPI001E28694E|nr:bifunctional GNAT family N-acetyltransferase/thioesterase [Paraneptunicella aestuarii]UAA38658.1 YiiD C-terminal domain-containing protein [Paraneptunicella aestuarii]